MIAAPTTAASATGLAETGDCDAATLIGKADHDGPFRAKKCKRGAPFPRRASCEFQL